MKVAKLTLFYAEDSWLFRARKGNDVFEDVDFEEDDKKIRIEDGDKTIFVPRSSVEDFEVEE